MTAKDRLIVACKRVGMRVHLAQHVDCQADVYGTIRGDQVYVGWQPKTGRVRVSWWALAPSGWYRTRPPHTTGRFPEKRPTEALADTIAGLYENAKANNP